MIMSDRSLLRRTQFLTIAGGVAAGSVVTLLMAADMGLGILIGALWSALNLRAMEGLMGAAVLPRHKRRNTRAILLWSMCKTALYSLALWLLVVAPLPIVGMAVGLTIMLAALVVAGLTTRPKLDGEGSQAR